MRSWDSLRRRYVGFWDGDVPDNRVVAHVQNPNPAIPPPAGWMLEDSDRKYLDPARLLQLKQWRKQAWSWHADLFDYTIPSYGPNVFAGFCGAKVVFGRDTVWHEPVIASLDEADELRFDPGNPFWLKHLEAVDYFCQEAAPRMQLGMTDFGGPADWISACMGTENFLVETIQDPARMRELALRLAAECNQAFDLVHARISRHNDGTCNWMPVWAAAAMGTVQDDMAVNFSPELYAEVFLPALRELAAHTPKTVLHWHDGCSQHIDALLRVEGIDLIQYGHDPNTGAFRDKLHAMRRIQGAGKKLFISCVDAEDVEFFIDNLAPEGLMMIVNTASDTASAAMESDIQKWTERRLAARTA